MRQQNGLLKIRVVKLLTGPAFGSRESFSHCMHGVDVDCQGRFFGPGVVHRCSRHLCILSLFLEANPSFSHLSFVFTLLHHLCTYINAHVPTCGGPCDWAAQGAVMWGPSLCHFPFGGCSYNQDLWSQTLTFPGLVSQLGWSQLPPKGWAKQLSFGFFSFFSRSGPQAPRAHAGEGRRLQYWIISQLCAGQQRIYHNPAALFSAFWRLWAQALFGLFVCFCALVPFCHPSPTPPFSCTHPPTSQHSADPIGCENKERKMCDGIKKSCLVLPCRFTSRNRFSPLLFCVCWSSLWFGTGHRGSLCSKFLLFFSNSKFCKQAVTLAAGLEVLIQQEPCCGL